MGRWLVGCFLLGFLLAGCGEAYATVQVVSLSPSEGVQVILSSEAGRWEGLTPWEVRLPPGRYFYAALFPGRHNRSGSFTVSGGGPLRIEIPSLEVLYGHIRLSSNAPARIRVDGVEVGTANPDPAQPAILGPFPVGEHVVSATAPLGEQGRRVRVAEEGETPVDFRWGSRLAVVVSPTEVPSLTVTVEGRPYGGPVDFPPDFPPSVWVEASAPGYTSWRGEVVLRAGEVLTASVVLFPERAIAEATPSEATQAEEEVLSAYWRYWEVWEEALRTLDGSHLPEVTTGTALLNLQEGLETIRILVQKRSVMEPFVYTPTITLTSDITAMVRAVVDVRNTPVSGGPSEIIHLDGISTFRKGSDGLWRMVEWKSLLPPKEASAPTPRPGGGGGGGGAARPTPTDREMAKAIILASLNCTRQAAGWEPVVWDQELADAFQPIVEEMGAYYSNHPFDVAQYRELFGTRVDALLQATGAIKLTGGEVSLSPVPRSSGFAYDWENYADRPCETDWTNTGWWTQEWMRAVRRVGIVLSTPYWGGISWESRILIVGRP